MPSISETAGLINAAGVDVASARTSCEQAQESIDRAKRALFEAMGEAQPQTLLDYQSALSNASAKLDQVVRFLDGGHDKGQEFIQRLYS